MRKVNIRAKIANCDYDITLDKKYTFIRGDSGTGKTTLIDILGSPTAEVSITDGFRLERLPPLEFPYQDDRDLSMLMDSSDFQEYVFGYDRDLSFASLPYRVRKNIYKKYYIGLLKRSINPITIFYCDEDDSPFITSEAFCSAIKHVNVMLLMVHRKNVPSVAYGIQNMYQMHTADGIASISPVYELEDFRFTESEFSNIFVEDKTAGYFYFLQINGDISTLEGRSNFHNYIDCDNTLFLLDLCGIGDQMQYIPNISSSSRIYPLVSFEKMILDSLHRDSIPDIMYPSYEEFYYSEVKKAFIANGMFSYNKNELNNCLSGKCDGCRRYPSCKFTKYDYTRFCYPDLFTILKISNDGKAISPTHVF